MSYTKKNPEFKIRAHHLMCIQGFCGHGYSKRFVQNMYKIINELKDNTTVTVINKTDDICKACKYSKNGKCMRNSQSNSIVKNMDNTLLKISKLKSGTSKSYKELISLINSIKPSEIKKICGKCDWSNICLFFKSRFKKN